MKHYIKKILVFVGLRNPAKGLKITGERKVEILLSYKGKKNIFVETGTNRGDTIAAMKDSFREIYSIELDPTLYNQAVAMFASARNIHLYHGDSGEKIYEVMAEVKEPALIWLDAHGSPFNLDNSPVRQELDAVFSHPVKGHDVLIDDARHFTVRDIREIKRSARSHGYDFVMDEGVFRLTK
ncbi:MAG: hypothetical protein Q7R69_00160 [bacterium]|nr:hypothetical protein [bacterium]